MESVIYLISAIQESWGHEATVSHWGVQLPFKLKCLFTSGIDRSISPQELNKLPNDFREFLVVSNGAFLFRDEQYGQWGLELFDLLTSIEETNLFQQEREKDKQEGDRIIGRFLGDSDCLLLRCDSTASDFGYVIIVNAIDTRSDWYIASTSFYDFLQKFAENQGAKYWESHPTR